MVAHEDLARTLWKVKAELERQVRDLYVASLSPRTLVYKALATGEQLTRFYRDLRDPDLRAEAAVFHRRYSTNTFSNWYLAQVFRTLAHNGEINTIKANRNAVKNLEAELGLGAIGMPQGSDSADMDRLVELFVSHGMSLLEALCRIMPMAWRDVPSLHPETGRFFRGVSRALGTLGAWEGPAAIVATDGRYVVGALDRMGLRPLRWVITRSGRVVLGSEIGAVPVAFDDVPEPVSSTRSGAGIDLQRALVLRPHRCWSASWRAPSLRRAREHRPSPRARSRGSAPPSTPSPSPIRRGSPLRWTAERVRACPMAGPASRHQHGSIGLAPLRRSGAGDQVLQADRCSGTTRPSIPSRGGAST